MGVVQEKFFYKTAELNDQEIAFVKKIIDRSPLAVREFNDFLLTCYTIPQQLKKKYKTLGKSEKEIEDDIKPIEVNMFEKVHCQFENMGAKLIQCRSLEELNKLTVDDWYEALTYLMVQYMRTNKMRIDTIEGFKEDGDYLADLADRVWPIVSCVNAMTVAKSVALDKNRRVIFLDNQTDTHFLTSDQPVINYVGDISDEEGFAKELELYYPISPTVAYYIHFNQDQKDEIISSSVDEEEVKRHNQKMFENSHLWLFADNKEQLEQYR